MLAAAQLGQVLHFVAKRLECGRWNQTTAARTTPVTAIAVDAAVTLYVL